MHHMAQQLEMLKQQEVLRLHDHLTRDMLLFAERKRWIAPDTDLPRGSKMKTRRYDDKQLRIIHYLNEAYKRGYSVEQIESVLADLSILANVDVSLLSRASSELINAVQLCDDKALIALVAQWGCRLLDAECCLIFLEPETLPGRLRLAAGTRYEKTTERFTKPQIRQTRYAKSLINGHPPFDMLDEINSRAGASPINAIVNLFHSDLADYKPSHLSTGCHSWMSIPLLDRKQRLFGYLVVENRFGKGSRPTPVVFFDEAIQRIGESYAIVLGALLNLYPTVIAQKRLLNPPKDKIPKTDLILVRDLLVHLSYNNIEKALEQIKKSGSKYLLTTSFPKWPRNFDIPDGMWRPINLEQQPFLMKEPLEIISEESEKSGAFSDKSLCLYEIDKINMSTKL